MMKSKQHQRHQPEWGNNKWPGLFWKHEENLLALSEYITGRFYFATLKSAYRPTRSKEEIFHFFNIDDELVYRGFYADFGPLNIGQMYRYWQILGKKLNAPQLKNKAIVHWTTTDPKKRANAAFLASSYAVFELRMSPRDAYRALLTTSIPLLPFQDANVENSIYTIRMMECLTAVNKAFYFNIVSFYDFDVDSYEHYEQIEHGDMSWILPQKLLAFPKPAEHHSQGITAQQYASYFKKNKIGTVVRLNKPTYDSRRFTWEGIYHHDLYFVDGSVPSRHILDRFLHICESTPLAVAVHCKAGLGRTGCLIGAYLMKHYRMSAQEAIAWMRICRPGCVIGHQQSWLESKQEPLMRQGDLYRLKVYGSKDTFVANRFGIYSIKQKSISCRESSPDVDGLQMLTRCHESDLLEGSAPTFVKKFRAKIGSLMPCKPAERPRTEEAVPSSRRIPKIIANMPRSRDQARTQGDLLNTAKARINRERRRVQQNTRFV